MGVQVNPILNESAEEALWDMYTSGLVLDEELRSLFGLTTGQLERFVAGRTAHGEKEREAQVSQG